MYFLGIDPGLSEVGFGIIEKEADLFTFVDCGIIKTTPENTFSERLCIIKKDFEAILKLYPLEAVGVEELFFTKNVTNGIKVAHARGVILQMIEEFKLPLFEFTPPEIKNNICGYGGADKLQVQEMVKRTLSLPSLPSPHDAADALAIAICTGQAFGHEAMLKS